MGTKEQPIMTDPSASCYYEGYKPDCKCPTYMDKVLIKAGSLGQGNPERDQYWCNYVTSSCKGKPCSCLAYNTNADCYCPEGSTKTYVPYGTIDGFNRDFFYCCGDPSIGTKYQNVCNTFADKYGKVWSTSGIVAEPRGAPAVGPIETVTSPSPVESKVTPAVSTGNGGTGTLPVSSEPVSVPVETVSQSQIINKSDDKSPDVVGEKGTGADNADVLKPDEEIKEITTQLVDDSNTRVVEDSGTGAGTIIAIIIGLIVLIAFFVGLMMYFAS